MQRKCLQTCTESVAPDQPQHPWCDLKTTQSVFFYKKHSCDLSADSIALISDCAVMQAGLELHSPHMLEIPFSCASSHIPDSTHISSIDIYQILCVDGEI